MRKRCHRRARPWRGGKLLHQSTGRTDTNDWLPYMTPMTPTMTVAAIGDCAAAVSSRGSGKPHDMLCMCCVCVCARARECVHARAHAGVRARTCAHAGTGMSSGTRMPGLPCSGAVGFHIAAPTNVKPHCTAPQSTRVAAHGLRPRITDWNTVAAAASCTKDAHLESSSHGRSARQRLQRGRIPKQPGAGSCLHVTCVYHA